ncbi:MAG: DUF4339 domain-containing protein [Rhabdochlamydiaceae bacterium]|nr:DUF4339 domain-containing protein [Candidatus Amphrikana amoebophyrae]
MPNIYLTLAIGLFLGYATSKYALTKDLNPKLWFVLGFFFGILAPLFLLLIHPIIQRRKAKLTPKIEKKRTNPMFERIDWYYLDHNHDQQGPMSFTAFKNHFDVGEIGDDTLIWNEEMKDWKELSTQSDIVIAITPEVKSKKLHPIKT